MEKVAVVAELRALRGTIEAAAVAGPTVASVEQAAPAATTAAAPRPQQTGDVVAHDADSQASSLAAFAGAVSRSQRSQSGDLAGEPVTVEMLHGPHGAALTALLAALPMSMRAAFLSQLATTNLKFEAEAATDDLERLRAIQSDLATLVIGGASDAEPGLIAARLVNCVERYGIDLMAQLLCPGAADAEHSARPLFPAYTLTPPLPTFVVRDRRQEDRRKREQQRKRRDREVALDTGVDALERAEGESEPPDGLQI